MRLLVENRENVRENTVLYFPLKKKTTSYLCSLMTIFPFPVRPGIRQGIRPHCSHGTFIIEIEKNQNVDDALMLVTVGILSILKVTPY